MNRMLLVLVTILSLIAAACGPTGSTSNPSGGGASVAPSGESASPGESAGSSAGAGGWDPQAISGTAILSGWKSSADEGEALTQALLGFPPSYPKISIDYQPIAGDYRTVMITKISSGEVPDLFYVNADYAAEWADQGFLLPLDDYIAKSGFDTSQFFEGYASIFKGKDGKTYGFPKDGNTIAMAYNSEIVTAPPTTMDELVTAATALKGKNDLKAPLCLNPGLDRGLAFLYAQGGELLNADGTASAIETDASKKAVQWYLDLFKDGLGMTAAAARKAWQGELHGDAVESGACGYLLPKWSPGSGRFGLMFDGGRFVRYDVGTDKERAPGGGRVGMTQAQVSALYPGRVTVQPHKYVSGGKTLRVTDPGGGKSALVFETDETGKITSWHVGLAPQVDYVEGCS